MAKGNKAGHRRFGNIRRLPSGRYQASYLGPDGQRRHAAETFERKGDADKALSIIEAEITQGTWTDPERGKITLAEYAAAWISPPAPPQNHGSRAGSTIHILPAESARLPAGPFAWLAACIRSGSARFLACQETGQAYGARRAGASRRRHLTGGKDVMSASTCRWVS